MDQKKRNIIIGVAAAVVVIAAVVIAVVAGTRSSDPVQPSATPAQGQQAEGEQIPQSPGATEAPKQEPSASGTPGSTAANNGQANSGDSSANAGNSQQPQEKVTPTFMYFLSKDDGDYEAAKKAADELKAQYPNVNFDIRDVTEDAEMAKRYSMEGNTPGLIMLNTNNDICAFEMKCSDKAKLEAAIKKGLQE